MEATARSERHRTSTARRAGRKARGDIGTENASAVQLTKISSCASRSSQESGVKFASSFASPTQQKQLISDPPRRGNEIEFYGSSRSSSKNWAITQRRNGQKKRTNKFELRKKSISSSIGRLGCAQIGTSHSSRKYKASRKSEERSSWRGEEGEKKKGNIFDGKIEGQGNIFSQKKDSRQSTGEVASWTVCEPAEPVSFLSGG
jgi:hypothetical protein